MNTILTLFENSIADEILGSFERKEIKAKLQDKNLAKRELDFIRSQIFDLSLKKINSENYSNIVNWLEEANKILNSLEKQTTTEIESYFSPGSECKQNIIKHISQAQKTLDVCVFTISDNEISKKLIEAHKRKVSVKIISDNEKLYDQGSDIDELAKSGIKIKIDNTSHHMHHKFALIDGTTLITGSYNWTRSAELYNHENIIVLKEPKVCKAFQDEFDSLWKEMSDF